MLLPSTLNWTLEVLEEVFVETVIVPETVAPEAGDVIETVGGVGGATLLTVTVTEALAVWPAKLLAAAVIVWLPLESVVVSSE